MNKDDEGYVFVDVVPSEEKKTASTSTIRAVVNTAMTAYDEWNRWYFVIHMVWLIVPKLKLV
jgi:hypothetical protein